MTVLSESFYMECASACAGVAAVIDVRRRRIPNWLTCSGALTGLLMHLAGGGMSGIALALLSGTLAGGIFLVLFIAGGMGAGDVKLMAAVGCLAGLHPLRSILISTVLAGAFAAIVAAAAQRRLPETMRNIRALVTHHQSNGLMRHPDLHVSNAGALRIPYAVPIAAGCILTMILSLCGGVSL